MTKHKQTQKIAMASTAVALGLAGIVGMTVPTHAEAGAEVKIDVNVKDALSLAVYPHGDHTAEATQLSLGDAMPGGDLAHNSLDLVVKTNVGVGYQLTMRDTDDDTSLAQAGGDGKVLSLENPIKASAFPVDRWGYTIGEYSEDARFLGIPGYTAEPTALIAQNTSGLPNEGETTIITFGAKIGASLEPGVYEDTVMFTVSPELIPTVPANMSEWTEGLYWDNDDLEGLHSWQEATEACSELGKRLPSANELRALLTAQAITGNAAGVTKITSAPYNFKKAIHLNDKQAGMYWSSNAQGDPNSQFWVDTLYIDNSVGVNAETNVHESMYGSNYSVRCVKDKE